MRDLLLLLSDSQFHSGEELGQKLGVTRAAIWKKLKKLQSIGVLVHSVKGKGYRLPSALELLDKEKIQQTVSSNDIAIQICFETDSTNTELKRQIEQGQSLPLLVVSEKQTQGKGRRGRQWEGGVAQNVMLSFGWCFESGTGAIEGLSLAVGVAVARVLDTLGVADIGLKWPNDIHINNQKICGILLEMITDSDVCQVIIGIGLNVKMAPQEMASVDQPWTDLHSLLGRSPSRNSIVGLLVNELTAICQSFDQGKGLSELVDEWIKYDILIGTEVMLQSASKKEFGLVKGITEKGALIFDDGIEVRHIYGGEVSVRKQ
ncbi:biotin--[acetyl-CoA-carboxylase] ligase [Marinomonas sp. 15G1-11]|uniref:Bifunctional ligase/repressor BirA n=1 Tax=Marinomonas phaeophyticola TaxID=3004091 RepID=A0ABT4JVX2_9GAMM|nr:biotin--[acetyl-CoA-carboxylase] ligase [Marinomonas sp. 15G1-11]MCZ2722530.1 biotin--[acetyl-CoA-carboxylase] ligase [Marinomonas sp. 15G1-11]